MAVVSADTTQVAIVKEDSPGVTPATPAFLLTRISGETLVFEPQTTEDTELSGTSRSAFPSDVTGMTVNGDLSFPLAKAPWLDLAISGVMAASWGACPVSGGDDGMLRSDDIAVGRTLDTFTIEKRFPDPVNAGQYVYQRYIGCSFSAMTLTVTPNEVITGTVTVVGGVPMLDTAAIAGATYVSAGSNPKFTAPKVVTVSVGSIFTIGTHCWNELTIALDSQNRGVPCIGTTGDREVVLGKLLASVSGSVYFTSQEILQYMLDNQVVGEVYIELEDTAPAPNTYSFQFFKVKVTAGSLNATGTGEDLTIPMTLEPTPVVVCNDGTSDWESSLIIGRAALPTVPPLVTAVVADAITAAPSVTFAQGPVYVPRTLSVTATTDVVTTAQAVNLQLPTDTTNEQIPALVVAAITAAQGSGQFSTDIVPADSTGGVLGFSVGGTSTTYTAVTATLV